MRKRVITISVATLGALFVFVSLHASDHLDSEYIDQYPKRDIGDHFVWTGDETGSPAFLINLNPLTCPDVPERLGLDPNILYEWKIDTDSDLVADMAYKITAGTMNGDGTQEVSLYKAMGDDADGFELAGEKVASGFSTAFDAEPTVIKGNNGELFFVGPRQDPFFFNFKGIQSPVALGLRYALSSDGLPVDGTAANTFGPTNITAIAVEAPELKGKMFTSWSTTAEKGEPQDRCGRSSVTAVFLPITPKGSNPEAYPYGELKQPYNTTKPDKDRELYGEAFIYRLGQVEVDPQQRRVMADFFLPDVLLYDPDAPQEYPNGRNLSEDAVYWTIDYINPFMAEMDTTLHLPETNPQPLTKTFPYAAPPIKACEPPGFFARFFSTSNSSNCWRPPPNPEDRKCLGTS